MGKKWLQEDVDLSIEKQIIAAMILSDTFIRKVRKTINFDYFQSEYCKIVSKWCIDYYDNYDCSPKKHIQDIFIIKTQSMEPEIIEAVSLFLTNLSEKYSLEDLTRQYETDYMFNKTESYFQLRSATLKVEKINTLLAQNKIDQLIHELTNYSQIKINISKGVNIISDFELLQEALSESDEPLLKLGGAFGELIGPLYRKFLLAIAGPAKRGKSFLMNDITVQSVMKGLNVAYFSMGDMTKTQMSVRTAQRLSARPKPKKSGTYLFPIRDCVLNQIDQCNNPERKNRIRLCEKKNELPLFEEANKRYRICTACYDKEDIYNKNTKYKPSVWYNERYVKELDFLSARRINEKFLRQYKGKYLFYNWPRGTGTISDIKAMLDMWEVFDNFIPDVIITDYADIMKAERTYKQERDSLNEIWQDHDALAKDRDVLVITGTHTNKETFVRDIKQNDISEDSRKMNHVNACIALNQSVKEKAKKIMRASYIFSRDDDFGVDRECILLQQLDVGQFCLDSFFI